MDKPGYHLTDFFHGLSEKQGDEIIRRGTTRDLKAQTVLFREGDPARQSYLVLKGRLKLGKVHELGKEVLIRYIGPGELAAMITVLLALLYLGVKGIRLGPTLPAFLSPTVAKVLVEKFDINPIGTVTDDVAAMMKGQ
jgi:hypothetical protein